MPSMNRVFLVGNLGRDPELHQTDGGNPVATLSLATTDRFKDAVGNKRERTDWHRVVVFRALATNCAAYLRKGDRALVEGRLRTREYEKDGVTRMVTEVIARDVQFLTPRRDAQGEPADGEPQGEKGPAEERIPF